MIGNFRLRYGFGIDSIILLAVFIVVTVFLDGYWRIIPAIVALLIIGIIVTKYWMYNSTPWRKIHYPGMMIYASIAGKINSIANNLCQDFDIDIACRYLASILLKKDINDKFIDDIMNELTNDSYDYVVSLFYISLSNNGIDKEDEKNKHMIQELTNILIKNYKMGPPLIIMKVIEIIYGKEEAARYVFASLNGDVT